MSSCNSEFGNLHPAQTSAQARVQGVRSAEWKPRREKAQTPNSEPGTQNSPGFTLIEVLLAMAIVAVILTVIYASFSSAGRNVEQAEAIREDTDIARALINRLSADIANAYVKGNINGVPMIFSGKKEEVDGETRDGDRKIRHDSIFLTTLTNWRRPDSKEMELWEVGYFFKEKPDGKGYMLFRKEKRELSKDVPVLEGEAEYELTDRVDSLQFRYSNDGKNWIDDGWSQTTRTPRVVEIALVLDNGKAYITQVDIGNR